jgi:exodeoxyribonuclease-3
MDQVVSLIGEEKPDLLCLQEIKASPDQLTDPLFPDGPLPDYVSYWHGGVKPGYSGVSLHVRKGSFPEPAVFTHPSFDLENRIAVATVGNAVFASIYVPNGGKEYAPKVTFLAELAAWAGGLIGAGREVCLCGDLNVAVEDRDVHPSQRKPIIGQLPEERELLRRMFEHGMTDVGRKLAPEDDRLFTWWPYWRQAREKNVGLRLDYVLASPTLAARAASCTVRRDFGASDHGPVIATFSA